MLTSFLIFQLADIYLNSTIASESAFSTSGRHLSPQQNRVHPKTLEALICTQDWLWKDMEGMNKLLLFLS